MTTPIPSSTPTGLSVPYLGISSPNPGNNWYRRRAPTTRDFKNYQVLDRWINKLTGQIYILQSKANGSATWSLVQAPASGIVPVSQGGTGVNTLTGVALGNGTAGFMGIPYTTITAWTPNIQINGSNTGITYASTSGFYQQFGAVVTFNASISLSSKGASTGAVTISNLPITTGINGALNSLYVLTGNVTVSANYTDIYLGFQASSTVANLGQVGSASAPISLSNTNVANNSSFLITGSYFTN